MKHFSIYRITVILLLYLFVIDHGLYAQNAPLGCDKYTMVISETVANGISPSVMAFSFPTPAGQMPSGGCDIGAGIGGEGIAIDPIKNIGYIANFSTAGVINVYDYVTGTFLPDITVGTELISDVILSADGRYLYATSINGIYKVDVATGTVVSILPLTQQYLWGIALSPTTGNIYYTNYFFGEGASTISFTSSNLGTPTIAYIAPSGYYFRGITFDSDGTLWAVAANSNGGNDILYHFSVNSNGTLSVISQYSFPANTDPYDIAIGPDGKIYIATQLGACVYQVDPITGVFTTYIPFVENTRTKGIAFVCGSFKCPCGNDINVGSITPTSGGCINGVAANNGTVTISGIGISTTLSSSMKADINVGSTYGDTPIFGASTNKTVSSGSVTFFGLAPNTTYTVRIWNGSDGCYKDVTFTTPALTIPSTPIASATAQPSCTSSTGTITVSSPTSGVTYSFDGGLTFQSSNTKSGLAPGTYQIVVKGTNGCNSATTSVTINPAPLTPLAPTVTATTITCLITTATITVTSPTSGVTYSFDNGATFQTSYVKSGLIAGTYQIKVKNSSGCVSSATSITITANTTKPTVTATGGQLFPFG